MDDVTRRTFVSKSAGAAAGVAAFGVLDVGAADARSTHTQRHHRTRQTHHRTGQQPIVAYVRNHRTGEIGLMSGDREKVVHDRKLAAMIVRHMR